MAKRIKKQSKSALKLETLETRQLLAGVTGAGTEVTPGGTGVQGDVAHFIQHPNGNKYDQVLLTGGSVSITNDPGQTTRVSFLDVQGDIVQAEFSGAGTFTISMADGYTTGVAPSKYNQTGVNYVQGLASFTISGSDASTNFNVFSVGSGNAVNTALFDSTHTGGDHFAQVQRLTVVADPANPNGSALGSIFAGNAVFTGSSGVVGISAANVQVQNVVRIGDIDASGSATPTLVFGTTSNFGAVDVQGGDLLQTNAKAINNVGSYNFGLNFVAGADSTVAAGGTANLPAQQPASGLTFGGTNPFAAAAKSLTLTNGIDTIVGGTGDDTISAQIGGTATLTPLDSIDGGAGTDNLLLNDVNGSLNMPGGLTIKNVETLTLASAGGVGVSAGSPFDTSGITGVTKLNVLASAGADFIKAGTGQAVTVSDSAGTVTLTGGTSQDVTTAGGYVLSGGTAAIKVTDTAQAAVASSVNGGTTVDITSTATNPGGTTGTITVGGTVNPSGAVTIKDTLVGDTTYTSNVTGGAITVTGGTTVSVTESVSQTVNPTTGGANRTVTEGAVTVNGTSSTTSVTVTQDAARSSATTAVAVAATTESDTVTFGALTAGQSVTFGGYTVIAPTGGLTGAQVASAFANLSSAALTSGWTTGPATTNQVTFTATGTGSKTLTVGTNTYSNEVITFTNSTAWVAGETVTILGQTYTATGGDTPTQIANFFGNTGAGQTLTSGGASWSLINTAGVLTLSTTTAGIANSQITPSRGTTVGGTATSSHASGDVTITTAPVQSVASIANITTGAGTTSAGGRTGTTPGAVTITNGGSSAITSVALTNYANSTITAPALNSLTLKSTSGSTSNGGSTTGTVSVTASTATSLDLTVDAGSNGNLGSITGNTYTALKVHTTGNNTTTNLIGSALTSLTVDGTKNLSLGTSSSMSALTSVTVSGSAGFSYAGLAAGVTDVNASGTSGNVSVTINPANTTYEGGSGTDTVTITAAPTKAISGGVGTSDVLRLNVAAGTFANPSANTNISGFETLELFNGNATTTVVGNASGSYNATGFTALRVGSTAGAVTFTNVAAGTPLSFSAGATQDVTYTLADSTGTADAITINVNGANRNLANTADTNLNAPGIELVTIDNSSNNSSVVLVDTAATSITVTGNKTLSLGVAGNTAITTMDASASTGAVTYRAAGTTAETVTGGSANDVLAAGATTNDTLNGNAGRDILIAGTGQSKLTGGADLDTFVVQAVPTTLNTYNTITDASAGEALVLANKGLETFGATAVTLGDTAAFKDFADAVVTAGGNASTNGYIGWFQYAGNTYVVESMHDNGTTAGFVNGTDLIVRLTGLVDLSKAGFAYSSTDLSSATGGVAMPNLTAAPEIVIR